MLLDIEPDVEKRKEGTIGDPPLEDDNDYPDDTDDDDIEDEDEEDDED